MTYAPETDDTPRTRRSSARPVSPVTPSGLGGGSPAAIPNSPVAKPSAGPVTGGNQPAQVVNAGARSGVGRMQKVGISLPSQASPVAVTAVAKATPSIHPRNIPQRAPRGRKGF